VEVEVRLFATLREGRFKQQKFSLDNGVSVENLLQQLGISPKDVSILLVNGRDAFFEQKLKDGDVISIFPPIGGG